MTNNSPSNSFITPKTVSHGAQALKFVLWTVLVSSAIALLYFTGRALLTAITSRKS